MKTANRQQNSNARKSNVQSVKSSNVDLNAVLAALQGAGIDGLNALGKAITEQKKAVREAAKEEKAHEARTRMQTATAEFASLNSELYRNKRGVLSRKVFLRSSQPGSYGKGNHQTCLMESDVAALCLIIEKQGADALAKVLLAARADRDASITAC